MPCSTLGLGTTFRGYEPPPPALAQTQDGGSEAAKLRVALENMAAAEPAGRFLGKYIITPERNSGGQATVQFARGGAGGFFQYAIKCAPCALLHEPPARRVRRPSVPLFRVGARTEER